MNQPQEGRRCKCRALNAVSEELSQEVAQPKPASGTNSCPVAGRLPTPQPNCLAALAAAAAVAHQRDVCGVDQVVLRQRHAARRPRHAEAALAVGGRRVAVAARAAGLELLLELLGHVRHPDRGRAHLGSRWGAGRFGKPHDEGRAGGNGGHAAAQQAAAPSRRGSRGTGGNHSITRPRQATLCRSAARDLHAQHKGSCILSRPVPSRFAPPLRDRRRARSPRGG